MSWTFYLVDAETHESTNWSPTPYLSVGPRLIGAGEHAGKYAVNVSIFGCDSAFESYRNVLESFPTAVCSDRDEWFPPPELPEHA